MEQGRERYEQTNRQAPEWVGNLDFDRAQGREYHVAMPTAADINLALHQVGLQPYEYNPDIRDTQQGGKSTNLLLRV